MATTTASTAAERLQVFTTADNRKTSCDASAEAKGQIPQSPPEVLNNNKTAKKPPKPLGPEDERSIGLHAKSATWSGRHPGPPHPFQASSYDQHTARPFPGKHLRSRDTCSNPAQHCAGTVRLVFRSPFKTICMLRCGNHDPGSWRCTDTRSRYNREVR